MRRINTHTPPPSSTRTEGVRGALVAPGRDADVNCINGIAQGSAKADESISLATSGVDANENRTLKGIDFFFCVI